MKRKLLLEKIVGFCVNYRLFNSSVDTHDIKHRIDKQLEDYEFIESLINTIILKTKTKKNVDIQGVKELLLELERIRLELEYKEIKADLLG